MNNNSLSYDIGRFKLVGKETHPGIPIIGKKNREIPCMITMGLTIGIPVFSRSLERIVRIPNFTVAKLMNMKAMGTYRGGPILCRLIGREAVPSGTSLKVTIPVISGARGPPFTTALAITLGGPKTTTIAFFQTFLARRVVILYGLLIIVNFFKENISLNKIITASLYDM
ncbi:MAG: hypothetical protein JG781_1035 [Peptococcaceae bacterium]|jgi:hypothetical protein|nr:hypothetical protein [Peptococcaceae bacterium]